MNNQAIIIGYSGHAYVLIDILLANDFAIMGYCDKGIKAKNPYNLKYLGNENDVETLKLLKDNKVFIGIGDNKIRAKIFEYLIINNVNCPSIIHPKSAISSQVEIGFGTIIMPGVVINAGVKIGNAVICNSSSVIEHECVIDNYVHIAPGAVLAGNVEVGESTFIGANSVINQGKKIGDNVTIGSGSVVIKDVLGSLIIYGNPAKQNLNE